MCALVSVWVNKLCFIWQSRDCLLNMFYDFVICSLTSKWSGSFDKKLWGKDSVWFGWSRDNTGGFHWRAYETPDFGGSQVWEWREAYAISYPVQCQLSRARWKTEHSIAFSCWYGFLGCFVMNKIKRKFCLAYKFKWVIFSNFTGYNRLKIVQILLQHGASVSSKDKG